MPEPIVRTPSQYGGWVQPSSAQAADRDPENDVGLRIYGIETEYGISVTPSFGDGDLHPMQLSNHVVKGYADLAGQGESHWDYRTESPLADQRGFEVDRGQAHPDQLTDTDLGMANVILTNGARLYVDHAHPEYSGPEVTSAREAVRFDKAGDRIMAAAARIASRSLGRQIRLYKNNTDGKGSSYGTHENYLVSRATPFDRIVTQFTGFLVSRIPLVGAGRVGLGQRSERAGFQISQRADFFEAEVGLETTMNRPIINTRDEPHADPSRHRRLHVITGDATCAEISTFLKVGSAALVLRMIEGGGVPDPAAVRLARPVPAMRTISYDLGCRAVVERVDGTMITATGLQRIYLDACRSFCERYESGTATQRAEDAEILALWQQVLDALDSDPLVLADRLDWVAKLKLLESYRARDGLSWDAAKLALVDLQWADVDPQRGLYAALAARGAIRRLFTDDEVEAARLDPPTDTRAWFRGTIMRRFPDKVVAASWDSVILDLADRPALHRIPLNDPLRGTRAQLQAIVDRAHSAEQLAAMLSR